MLNSIPDEIQDFCKRKLGELSNYNPASGGCINNGGRVITAGGEFFLKWNAAGNLPGMFTAEENGLKILSETACIRVPEVIAVHEGTHFSCIIMEMIFSNSPARNYWADLAKSLACVHQVTRKHYGLDHNNYIGSLPQYNTNETYWVDFFISYRLQPQVELAYNQGKLKKSDLDKFYTLEKLLPDLLPEERPALTHGDLWSGNLMVGQKGEPVLIDPAVAYVNREMEIAFTRLFGGFDQEFYDVYQEVYPMLSGYQERFNIYNLYPLLVHVNLFGGGYYQQVMAILSRF